MQFIKLFLGLAALVLSASNSWAASVEATLIGERTLQVIYEGKTYEFKVPEPTWVTVEDETYSNLPLFNEQAPSWAKGIGLKGVKAFECSVFGALDENSFSLTLSDGSVLKRGVDYELDNSSGCLGRLEGGCVSQETIVLANYRYIESRIDSVVVEENGSLSYIDGVSKVLSPEPPVINDKQQRLVNIYTTVPKGELSVNSIFPVDEVFSHEPNSLNAESFVSNLEKFNRTHGLANEIPTSNKGAARSYLPKVWEKLQNGEEVRILAWGDSVTACGYLPDNQRWQTIFAEMLQKKFPNAHIVMLTEAWGGRSSDSYRNEPSGSPKNYQERVLALQPDLIISEFVNDAYMDEETTIRKYSEMLEDFRSRGIEWIILGPHYVRPDWMGLSSERNAENDPRPLIKGLRRFTAENNVPFADTPTLYGKLSYAGIPYLTLMTNNINHPNEFGMKLFANALITIFEEK